MMVCGGSAGMEKISADTKNPKREKLFGCVHTR